MMYKSERGERREESRVWLEPRGEQLGTANRE